MPLEPNIDSVTNLKMGDCGSVVSNMQIAGWENEINSEKDCFYEGILAYFDTLTKDQYRDCVNKYNNAISLVAKKIHAPSKKDVTSMVVGSRSYDFGRGGQSAILDTSVSVGSFLRSGNIRSLIGSALWQEGQLVSTLGFIGTVGLKVIYQINKINFRIKKATKICLAFFGSMIIK